MTLERIRSFVRVAERGTLSSVARDLGVGQSTITRHVAELERALGASLLSRTTRRVTLTDEGKRYYAEACMILRLVDEATDGIRDAGGDLAGSVRVSCTAALGVRHVTRILFEFQDKFPGINIDLSLSDARIDLVREAADIAIRLGPLADSSMHRKAIGASRRVLVASRDYLKQHNRPVIPDDLARHETVRLSNVAGSDTLNFRGPKREPISVPFGGRFLVNHGLAAREAVLAGRGIAVVHVWLVDDLLANGTIEALLPGFDPEPVDLSMLFVPGRARIKRVRALIDALAVSLAMLPGVDTAKTARSR